MSSEEQLLELYKKLELNYKKMPLAEKAEDMIPGEGSSTAEVFFIGEAPGKDEVAQRRPFVGRSGKLFRKTLVEEAEMKEADVFISNIVKVRPPENRDPKPDEIKAYKPYLDKEIDIVDPTLVVTLGRYSMGKFLHDVKISEVHGKLHKVSWKGKRLFILPMYHPAAVRSNKVRAAFFEDFKKIPKIIDWVNSQQKIETLKANVEEFLF